MDVDADGTVTPLGAAAAARLGALQEPPPLIPLVPVRRRLRAKQAPPAAFPQQAPSEEEEEEEEEADDEEELPRKKPARGGAPTRKYCAGGGTEETMCCFSREELGQPSRANRGSQSLLCSPTQMTAAVASVGGKQRITQSLRIFLAEGREDICTRAGYSWLLEGSRSSKSTES